MTKKSKSKPTRPNRQLKWIVIIAVILVITGFTYWFINSDASVKDGANTNDKTSSELSEDLIKANKLTQDVYFYVEQVEMKKMTKEEAAQKSSPIKAELNSLRAQLSKEELMYNDSIRKVLGNIMVENVMKWRVDNGLIKPEDRNSIQPGD